MTEHRKHTRVKVDRMIQIILSDGTRVSAEMINISNAGIGILYPVSADIGTNLKIAFTLPCLEAGIDSANDKVYSITTKVVVSQVHFSHDQYQIGLDFDHLKSTDEKSINKFLQNKQVQKSQTQKFIVVNK